MPLVHRYEAIVVTCAESDVCLFSLDISDRLPLSYFRTTRDGAIASPKLLIRGHPSTDSEICGLVFHCAIGTSLATSFLTGALSIEESRR